MVDKESINRAGNHLLLIVMIDNLVFDLQASVTKTASFNGASKVVSDYYGAVFLFAVTASSGTSPTLDPTIEGSFDNTNWYELVDLSWTQATGTTTEMKYLSVLPRFVRAVATIGGVMNLVGLLLADIAYAGADPRISFEGAV